MKKRQTLPDSKGNELEWVEKNAYELFWRTSELLDPWRTLEELQTLATNSLVVVVIHTFCVQKHLCPHIFVSTHFVSGHTLAKCISFWNIVPTHIRHPSLDIFE